MVGTGWELADRDAARGRLWALLAVAGLYAILLSFAAPARASRAVVGTIGTPLGSGKGQVETPRGVAVNTTGAGGVGAGDLYVVDGGDPNSANPGNNRIEEFSADGNFVRAWGVDVVASGPDDKGSGAFEVCLPADICKAGSPSAIAGGMSKPVGVAIDQDNGNVYVIDTNSNKFATNSRVDVYSATGAFEGAFGWDVSAASPEEKLQFCTAATGCKRGSIGGGAGQLSAGLNSLPAVDPSSGSVYVPDGSVVGEGNFRVDEFAPVMNISEEVIGVSFVKTFGWDVVASGPDQSNEIQKISVRATSGKFKLTFGANTTTELDFAATAEEVEGKLNELPSISSGGGSVEVSGGPGNANGSKPYIVTFNGGPLAHEEVPQMSAVAVGLSGGVPTTGVAVETYSNGKEGLESCVVANGDICKAGTEGNRLGQFSNGNPTSVAVDESGAAYVVNQSGNFFVSPGLVWKFRFPAEGEVTAEEFAPANLTQTSGNPDAVNPTDVAVDPVSQHVLVAKKEGEEAFKFLEFDSSGTLLDESPAGGAALEANTQPAFHGLAIGTGDRFYFSNPVGEVDIFGPPPPPTVEIEPVAEVGATTVTFNGKVTPSVGSKGEHFGTSYHFEYSRNGISWTPFPAGDVAVGDGSGAGNPKSCPTGNPPSCEVSQKAFGLQPNADYLVRLVATNGSAATSSAEPFVTKAAAPSVSGMVATQIGQGTAKLTGLVNPNNQPTTYHFEWGETTAYGNEVPTFEAFAGSDGQATRVVAPIGGLKGGNAYHFRIVATNAAGTTDGLDQEFTTLDSFGLPDGRAPEQTSPNDKRPVGMVSQFLEGLISFQVATDGNAILYPLLNGLPSATAGGNVEYLGRRSSSGSGWESTQMTPPSLVPPFEAAIGSVATGRVIYGSADLSCELVESFEPLSEDTPPEDLVNGVRNLYRRNEDGTYTLLSAPVPPNKSASGSEAFHVDWVSTDCDHVLFDSEYRFTGAAPLSGRILYEWEEGGIPPLRIAGIRPDESVAGDALAGAGAQQTNWNSMSADGSKVFFTATSNSGGDSGQKAIFVRKNGSTTVDASQSHTATPSHGGRYQMASADGSHLFFTANYGLTATTSAGATTSNCAVIGNENTGRCDLYDYEVETATLRDLSADANSADLKGAGVIGILDASDHGSYVYFAARGQLLANKGKTEAQNLLGNGSYNVYLSHGGSLSFVGLISTGDTIENGKSGSDLAFKMAHWVADATPDGTHLLFVSKANVTGFDSKGVAEAYLYSAVTGETVCVSCRTDGQALEGDGDTEPIKAQALEGFSSLVKVQNRARSISDDGSRVFFEMPDTLAAGAKGGARNIYEWEKGQVYLLAAGEGGKRDFTEFADSSASGNDIFVVTKARLVGQDFDSTTDLYDLRAPHVPGEKIGPEPVEPEPEPCDPLAHQCRGPATPQPSAGSPPASEGFTGPGNPPKEKPKSHPHKGKKHKKHRHKKPHDRHHHNRAAGNEEEPAR